MSNKAPEQNSYGSATERINSMTSERLKALVISLKQENENGKAQCKIIQAECDKYRALNDQMTSKLKVAHAELANKDKELACLKQKLNSSKDEPRIQSLKQQFDEDIAKMKKEFVDQTKGLIHALRQQFHEDIRKAKCEFQSEAQQMQKKLENLRQETC